MTLPTPNPVAGMQDIAAGLPTIAYFSMEIGLRPELPTYSGGLGVLAGDTLWSAADLGVPMVAVTLLHRKGYFRQELDDGGVQSEVDEIWSPEERLEPLVPIVSLSIGERRVYVRAFVDEIEGVRGHRIPVYFLDTDLPENADEDRALTDRLYGGDERYRLGQELVLGMGGFKMLRALGYESRMLFHMNEGHSSLLTLALVEEELRGHECPERPDTLKASARQAAVFTTHTPVPAGHDSFAPELVTELLGERRAETLRRLGCFEGELNMTHVGMELSRYINGVAMRHGEVSREMFPERQIASITNGVHISRWITDAMGELLDRRIPEWRADNAYLRNAIGIPAHEIREAHGRAKAKLFDIVRERSGTELDPERMTIGFARRAAEYKRPDFLFHDVERLRAIAATHPIQVVFAGKAHPRDEGGKAAIRRIFEAANTLDGSVKVIYLEDYNMGLARDLLGGVDVWLNNPTKPHEASGTSGMKAAVNGVPNLSVLDGWWIEGHVEGVTGWSIGDDPWIPSDTDSEAHSMYDKLEQAVLPLYYGDAEAWSRVMQSSIALNGSFFNTQRMVKQYVRHAYAPE